MILFLSINITLSINQITTELQQSANPRKNIQLKEVVNNSI